MAILTEPLTQIIHGTNPEILVEKIVRAKIRQSTYWKQHCFGLTAETLVDKATDLDHTGGTYGGNRMPTPFLCLALKMLEIRPDKEIVVEFIRNEDYKYVRLLGAFYLRLTGANADVYRYLDPLYNDYRKIRRRLGDGKFALTHVDQFVDELLTTDNCCDTALPRIQKRWVLEACGTLERKISVLEDDFEEDEEDNKEDGEQPMDVDEPNNREKEHYRRTKEEDMDTDRDMKHERRRRNRDHDRDSGYYDRNFRRGREDDIGHERDRDGDHHRIRDNDYSRERYYEGEGHRRRRGHCSCCSLWRLRDDGMREEPKRRKEIKETKGASKCPDPNDPEIIEANKLRASLGLKPLRLLFAKQTEDKVQPMDIKEPNTREKEHYPRGRMPTIEDMDRVRMRQRHHWDRDISIMIRTTQGDEKEIETITASKIMTILKKDTMKADNTVEDVDAVTAVINGVSRMMTRERSPRKENKETKGASKCPDPNDPEIIEMNKLRASLGLKPLW